MSPGTYRLVMHGLFKDPNEGPWVFLITRGGATGLTGVRSSGTTEDVGGGFAVAAAMNQNTDLMGDINGVYPDSFGHSTDGGHTWSGVQLPQLALPAVTPPESYSTWAYRVIGTSAPGVMWSAVSKVPPYPTDPTEYLMRWEGGTWTVVDTLTSLHIFASSTTGYLQPYGLWVTANGASVWWPIAHGTIDGSYNATFSSHLRRHLISGGDADIDFTAIPDGASWAFSELSAPNHDDSDSILIPAYSNYPTDVTWLFKVVGTTVTDLAPAAGEVVSADWWGSTIFVTVGSDIKKSTDGGSSFSTVYTASEALGQIKISQTDPNKIIALCTATSRFVYSTNGGGSWVETAISFSHEWGIQALVVL